MNQPVDFSKFARNASKTEQFAAGDVVFSAGDPGRCMYIVKSGAVEIRVGATVVDRVEAGGLLGEMALVDRQPRSATAVAGADCELVPVDERQFTFLVQQTPFFALDVMKVIAARLRQSNQQASGHA